MSSTYLRTSTCRPALCKVRIIKACRRSTASPHPGANPQVLLTAPLTAPCMRMRLFPLYMFSAQLRA
eukprot:2788719-Amphidinium_carterae.1